METHAPTEDIGAVLSRFQAWTSSQTGAPSKGKSKNGIRELSYEEAIGKKRRSEPLRTAVAPSAKKAAAPPAPEPQETPRRKARAKKKKAVPRAETLTASKQALRRRHTDFRSAMEENAAMVPARATTSLVAQQRPLTLSIRISEQEQLFLKTRAEEESLSVSAYLRHCAFEVEHLRNQLQQTADREPVTILTPSRPGFLMRLGRLLGLTKTTTLTLRA